jgi:hypothetical protein
MSVEPGQEYLLGKLHGISGCYNAQDIMYSSLPPLMAVEFQLRPGGVMGNMCKQEAMENQAQLWKQKQKAEDELGKYYYLLQQLHEQAANEGQ